MKNRNLFWGLFFILASVLIVFNQMGYLLGITTLNLVLLILLAPVIIHSIIRLEFVGIFFPLAVIGIMFSKELGINNLTPIPILVVALFLSIGFSILFKKRTYYSKVYTDKNLNEENFEQVIDVEDEDVVNYSVRFGSSIKYINSDNFKKANLSCSFGALKIYLDNAKINEDGAIINLDVSFGAMEIYIPKDCKVINELSSTLSGVEEKYHTNQNTNKTIKLTGSVNLSGVDIIYV